MFKIYLIFFFLIMLGCSQKAIDPRIDTFEKVLGAKETKVVNSLVKDFEENLHKIYPEISTEKGYRKYLEEMISPNTTNWDKFKFQTKKTNYDFHKSGLWNEIYVIDNGSLDINQTGKYIQALYAIKDSDPLIKKYIEKRAVAGMMKNEIVVRGILSSNPDFINYFHKRIVVLEFSF